MTDEQDVSLAGLLWSDEPAETDLLAAQAIADTVADAVLDDALDPLSLGLSGPWGSGKTTVLELIATALNTRDLCDGDSTGDAADSDDIAPRVLVVRTDPWRYDPTVGAKESIIADILGELATELASRPGTAGGEAIKLVKRLAKRVDWAKALKVAAKTAVAFQLPSIGDITELIKSPDDDEDEGSPRGLAGFHAEFAQLMDSKELGHIRRVAVLVDDLDRCLAKTVVETLETIRLFLSVPRMAFIIAADEDRVADAIKAELPAWEMPKERPGTRDALPAEPPWKLYLHKIVQTTVPLPALGAFDTEAYLLLLQVQNRTANRFTQEQLEVLIEECGRLRAVGALDGLDTPDGLDVQHELAVAHRLTAILYEKLAGNPRRIKRFLNDMNVRRTIAARRGIKLNTDIVAKMMTLEVLLPRQFTEVLSWLRAGELRDRLTALEYLAHEGDSDHGTIRGVATQDTEHNHSDDGRDHNDPESIHANAPDAATKLAEAPPTISAMEADAEDRPTPNHSGQITPPAFEFDDDLVRWAKLEPPLAETDLSPYLHLAASFSGDLLVSDELPSRLRDLVHQLNATGPLHNRAADELAAQLPVEDARILVRFFGRRARDRPQEQRGAVTAIGRLATSHPALAHAALDAFRQLPVDELQPPTAMYLKSLSIDGIQDVINHLAARAQGPVHKALTTPLPRNTR